MHYKDSLYSKNYTEEPTDVKCVRSLPVFLAVSTSLGISYLFISRFWLFAWFGFFGWLVAVFLLLYYHTLLNSKFREKILLQDELVQVGCVKEN